MAEATYQNYIAARYWTVKEAAHLLAGVLPDEATLQAFKDDKSRMNLATGGQVALLYWELKNATMDGRLTTIEMQSAADNRVKPGEAIAFARGLGIEPPDDLVRGLEERGEVPDWQGEADRLRDEVTTLRAELEAAQQQSKPISPSREMPPPPALLRLALGMAMAKYDHNPDADRSRAYKAIEADLKNTNLTGGRTLTVEVTSIRDYLKRAAEDNPRKAGGTWANLQRPRRTE